MGKKYLITTKKKVNRYYATSVDHAKKLKYNRLKSFWSAFKNEDEKDLFAGKKYSLVDEVIFKTGITGVYHCRANRIKTKCRVGANTLADFNNYLKKSKQFIVARYRSWKTNCGGLVYIDTQHANFYDTMADLFGMDQLDTDIYLHQTKSFDMDFAIKVDDSGDDSIQREMQDDMISTYAENDLTKEFYRSIMESPALPSVKRYAYKLAMRIDKNVTASKVIAATKAYYKMLQKMRTGDTKLEKEGDIVKVFSAAFAKSLDYPTVPAEKPKGSYKKAPFYNWITDR